MAVRDCALYVCARAYVYVYLPPCKEAGMPPTGNGNVLLPWEDGRRWRGRESGCERVLSGRRVVRNQTDPQVVLNPLLTSYTSYLNRENPLWRLRNLRPLFLWLNLRFYFSAFRKLKGTRETAASKARFNPWCYTDWKCQWCIICHAADNSLMPCLMNFSGRSSTYALVMNFELPSCYLIIFVHFVKLNILSNGS